MPIEIDEDNLKHGLLGLVVALLEVIRDALRHQAVRRVESGVLSDEECERLGRALMELEDALEEIKEEQGITESVRAVRDGLDELVDDVIDRFLNPESWQNETEELANDRHAGVGLYAGRG